MKITTALEDCGFTPPEEPVVPMQFLHAHALEALRNLDPNMVQEDITDIVFGGGGPKGWVYVGLLVGMSKGGLPLRDLGTRFFGTSIGALFAFSVAAGAQPADFYSVFLSMEELSPSPIRLLLTGGLYNFDIVETAVKRVFAALDLPLSLTMREFAARTGKELGVVYVEQRGYPSPVYVTSYTPEHADCDVFTAVCDSMRIPIVFPAHDVSPTSSRIDGGVLENVPLRECGEPKNVLAFEFAAPDAPTQVPTPHQDIFTKLVQRLSNTADILFQPSPITLFKDRRVGFGVDFVPSNTFDVPKRNIQAAVLLGYVTGRLLAAMLRKPVPRYIPSGRSIVKSFSLDLRHIHMHHNVKIVADFTPVLTSYGVSRAVMTRVVCTDAASRIVVKGCVPESNTVLAGNVVFTDDLPRCTFYITHRPACVLQVRCYLSL